MLLSITLAAAMLLSGGAVVLAQQQHRLEASGAERSAESGRDPLARERAAALDAGAASSEPVALGARVTDVPANPAALDEFSGMVGAQPAVVMWFQSWSLRQAEPGDTNRFDPAQMDAVASRGAMPMITWQPWDPNLGSDQPEYRLKAIARGKHDAYVRQWARDAKAWGKPFYLRFAHEMNGTWYPWSPGANGKKGGPYVAAWKRVHGIFEQEGATNARWVWSPYVACGSCVPYDKVYPGDAYVDWVALDGYNWGTSQGGTRWQSMAEVFGPSYDKVRSLAPGKPFMIAEVSSAEAGGDKAGWIRTAFSETIPARLPATRAVIWFHRNKDVDWRVNSSEASLAAYREVAASPSYAGRLP